MQRALRERESGAASLEGAAAFGHRPQRFHAAALGDAGLARRLMQTASLAGHSGAVNTLSWAEGGELLASGGEDCRLRLWRAASGELLHSFDTGHTANILGACFLPATRGDQLICCSADRQIRHLNVTKGAVRPYLVHSGRVRCVVPLDPHLFLSASEDGTVREFDVRQRPAAVHREALAGDDSNVLVDQRAEKVGRSRVRVGIYSLAIDEQRPWLMLTGGTDPLLRLYDRRMLVAAAAAGGGGPGGDQQAGGSRSKAPQWVSCYAPSHIKSAVWDSGRHPGLATAGLAAPAGRHVTCVAFARGGSEVVGSYSGEFIYSFDTLQHARNVEALLHIPETVLRAPTRPRSHTGRRSMHNFAPSSQGLQWQSPAARVAAATGAAAEAAAEGAGGTAPGSRNQLPAELAQAGQLRQWLQARPLAGRAIAIAPSVRQLEQQRRQQSRVAAAAAAEPARAESSRPAHWQMHPTSSTLRSPQHEPRQHILQQHQQQLNSQQQQQQHELVSDSEGVSEGVSPEGPQQRRRLGVRRSSRIMRRRRDAAEALEMQQLQEDAAAEEAAAVEQQLEMQQPAVSGVAEPAAAHVPSSSSEGEDPEARLPATRRRVRQRTLAGSAADENLALVAQQQDFGGSGGAAAAAGAAAGFDATAAMCSGGGGFKAPAGRSPLLQRRQAAAAVAAAMQRLDSTVGLLHHHAPHLEASEVSAGGNGCWDGARHAQQEATVSMGPRRQPAGGGGRQQGGQERFPAVEVSSRPVPSASNAGLLTQLGSQQAGHEASSLNSAEQPGNEHVGSVAQRRRADAPSVGNAPATTTAAAEGAAAAAAAGQQQQAQQQQAAEALEASTGHNVGPRTSVDRWPPPPQFGASGQQQQQQAALAGTRPRQHLQPTASTGTSRPPAHGTQQQHQQRYLPPQASGRQASRLRRHSAVLQAAEAAAATAAVAAGSQAAGGATAAPDDGQQLPAAAQEQQQQQQHVAQSGAAQHAAVSLQQSQPQATMLSGRGPSVLGDFMPGQQQPVDSDMQQQQQQQQASVVAHGPAGAGTRQAAAAAGQQQKQRGPVESNIGAIVQNADAGGEEVSDPAMYLRCYAGHLNLSPTHNGLPLAPQLAFLGLHSELLASPSDDGNIFMWDYATGRLAAVLPPAAPAGDAADGGMAAAGIAGSCVVPHPLLPMLASGGTDSVVRLWSPEAEQQYSLQHAAEAVQANLQRLSEAGLQPVADGLAEELLLGAAGSGEAAMLQGPDGHPMRCGIM